MGLTVEPSDQSQLGIQFGSAINLIYIITVQLYNNHHKNDQTFRVRCLFLNCIFFSAERLTGTVVSVCDLAETSCHSCGTAAATGAGQWAEVTCAAGAVGSIVKVITPNSHFQACEVEVFGQGAQAG